ncbi:PAS domain S-box protein [Bdellovibrionota bacterium FG-2]
MKTLICSEHECVPRALIEAISDPVFMKDLECRIMVANSATIEAMGASSPEEVIGKLPCEVICGDSGKKVFQDDRRVMETGQTQTFEETLTFPSGKTKIFLTTKSPHRDANGSVIGLVGISRDITEMKKAEGDLKASEERFRGAFEQSPFSTQLLSADGRTIGVNPAMKKLWGFDQATIDNFILKKYLILEDLQLVTKGIMPYIKRGFAGEVTTIPLILYDPQVLGMGGRPRWVEGHIYPIRDSNGRIQQVVLTHRDITDRKYAEDALLESETRFRLIFESSPAALIMSDDRGIIALTNSRAETLFGYGHAELVGKPVEILVPEHFRSAHVAQRDLFALRKDGTEIPVEIALTPLHIDKVNFVLSTMIDISKRKRTEQEKERLLVQERNARQEVECTKWRSDFLSDAGRILTSSLNYESTLNEVVQLAVPHLADWCMVILRDESVGVRNLAVVADPSKAAVARKLEHYIPDMEALEGIPGVIRTGEALLSSEFTSEVTNNQLGIRDPNHLQTIQALGLKSFMVVPLSSREYVLGALLIASSQESRRYNVSDLEFAKELARRCSVALENARLYKEAQEAIRLRDDFLSIASHELKTPLTSLGMQIQLLDRMFEQGTLVNLTKEKASALFKISRQQLGRFSTLVNDLLDGSRIGAGRLTLNIEKVELSELIRGLIKRFEPELSRAECVVSVRIEGAIIGSWDRIRIEQVISNLLTNAMKYGAGKPLQITAKLDGEKARISFQDHGIGVAKIDQARIFERFERAVSLKSFGGLGLGLFITRQIVEAHGGTIRVESELGKGSLFIVELPIKSPERIA